MKDSWILSLLGVVSLCFMFGMIWQQREWVFRGANDFIPLSSGARLLATGELYSYKALQREQVSYTGMYSETHGYIRLPFHAALVWPLSRLSYPTAYWIWQGLSIAAFAGFIALWHPPELAKTFLFAALSMPVFVSLMRGQDVCFLLFVIALSVWLVRGHRGFAAGLVFSLCAAKFHLFVLAPILIVAQRRWSFGKGLLAGGGVLALVSFAAAGWSWPVEFIHSAMNPIFSPNVGQMPNLHGLLAGMRFDRELEIVLGLLIAAGMWWVARRTPFRYSLAYALAGGLLLSHHAYMLDMAFLLPAGLVLIEESRSRIVKAVATLLLIPPLHVAVELGRPSSVVAVLLLVVLVCAIVYEARARQRQEADSPHREAQLGAASLRSCQEIEVR